MNALRHPLLLCILPSEDDESRRVWIALAGAGEGVEQRRAIAVPIGFHPLHAVLQWHAEESHREDLLVCGEHISLPAAGRERLRWAAYSNEAIGAVSPGFAANSEPLQAADRVAYHDRNSPHRDADRIDPRCVYLRSDALAAIGEEAGRYRGKPDAFPARLASLLRLRGFCAVSASHVCAADTEGAISESPAYASHPPIPGVDAKPVQLHLIHDWGGGAMGWARDFCRADRDRDNLVLKPIGDAACYARGYALYRYPDDARPLRCWTLHRPIRSTEIAHLEYRQILLEICDEYSVSWLVISSLAGHSLDALSLDVPAAVVGHDYYPFCPAFHVSYPYRIGSGSQVCASCTEQQLCECLDRNAYCQTLPRETPEHWGAVRRHFVERILARGFPWIVPSDSVRRHLQALEPQLASAAFHVVPHGMQRLPAGSLDASPDIQGEWPRAVILGRLSSQKGAALLQEALPQLAGLCDVFLLGCGEHGRWFEGRPRVTVIPEYRPDELPLRLAEIRPHFAMLLSVVPETFSYTLSELMGLGIPTLATRLGAPADRIRDGVNGFLVEPNAIALVHKVREICAAPERLAAVRRVLAQSTLPSLAGMVEQYHDLLPVAAFDERLYAAGLTRRPAVRQEPPQGWTCEGGLNEPFDGWVNRTITTLRARVEATPRLVGWRRSAALLAVSAIDCAWSIAARFRGKPPIIADAPMAPVRNNRPMLPEAESACDRSSLEPRKAA